MSLPDEVVFAGVETLGARLRARSLSPLALVEALLERIEVLDGGISAFLTVTPERALADARRAEAEIAAGAWRGSLHGIPYALKDLVDTAGVRTTAGAPIYRDRVPAEDATVERRLRDAGAILLGKLSMVELAGALGQTRASASLNGACRNPWDRSRWTGGSSSGTAAAVAAGFVPFALGTEARHSMIGPAAFCGVSALLPTYGRVSRHGVMPVAWSFDRVGVAARRASDCGLVLAAIAGADPKDRASVTPPPSTPGEPANAAVVDPGGVDPDVQRVFDAAVEAVRGAGVTVGTAALPDLPATAAARLLVHVETRAVFEEVRASGERAKLADPSHRGATPEDPLAGPPTALEYVKAQRVRTLVQDAYGELLARHEVLLAPANPVDPPPVHEPLDALWAKIPDALADGCSLAGLPVITVPCGTSAAGMPVGLRLVGRPFDESRLLALAAKLQARTDWHRARPKLSR